ncbi:hypothetical protein MMC08_000718 [Hypocenomyce scalaris]|nr:hypothetical protein [Hypocenomyce scalaris]
MSTDYSKRKNAELEDLLKARSLPHTGKKADLVARLQQYDKEHPSTTTTPTAEDEIDWEDDTAPAAATSEASAAALAAGGQGAVDNPVAVPNQVIDTDPATTDDLTVNPPHADPPTTTTAPAPATASTEPERKPADFAVGLSTTSLDAELAKRQKRAARFGVAESSADAVKALERAKRFGTGAAEEGGGEKEVVGVVKGLDTALPERGARKRGRGTEEAGEAGRGGKRRDGGGRGRRDGGRGGSGGLGEKDRVAAEARKKRFAAAA